MENQKISVVVPNYNYAKFLPKRLKSILAQKQKISELIILDDGSTDGSAEVILREVKKIKEKYPGLKIKIDLAEKNGGSVFLQWAKGFKLASEEFVWIAEADDLCSNKFLETVTKGFLDSEVVLSYTESRMITSRGLIRKRDLRGWADYRGDGHWRKNYINNGKDELSKYLVINCTIPNVSAVVFRRKEGLDFLGYLEKARELRLAGDWYFYAQVLLNGKIAYFRKSLNYHRVHNRSVTNTTNGAEHYREIKKVQEFIRKNVKIDSETEGVIARHDLELRERWGL